MIIEIIGLVFEIIIGTIGHFLYEWSDNNKIIGFMFSKNESTWEHIKLGITPIILWTIVELFTKNFNNLFFAKFFSIITFALTLLVLHILSKNIFNKNVLVLDISIFYISLFLSSIVSIKLLSISDIGWFLNFISFIGIIFIIYLYYKLDKIL